MNRFLFLLGAMLLAPLTAVAQVTAPSPTPTHQADTSKSYSLTTLRMTPMMIFSDRDNAQVDSAKQFQGAKPLPDSFYYPGERHLKNIRQLTFQGENAEAYLSADDKFVCFQAHGIRPQTCDQIYMMPLDGSRVHRISQGYGRTTCSYFYPSGDTILFASTHAFYGAGCPPEADMSHGYVWPLYAGYDIYLADTNGKPLARLTNDSTSYDAEATISPKGDRIVFTSTRTGDIELFSMKLDGSDVKQLTHEVGYDGGAFYGPDGKEIVYRASRPEGEELKEYKELLAKGLVKPYQLEIMVMNADGSNKRQVTHLKAASFAPFFHPDGQHIIFSSNYLDPKGREFNLFMIKKDGTGLEQITFGGGFNSFPMFTRDGKHLVFCSNRNGSHPHNTNIFVADWAN
jgi:TolB protein